MCNSCINVIYMIMKITGKYFYAFLLPDSLLYVTDYSIVLGHSNTHPYGIS